MGVGCGFGGRSKVGWDKLGVIRDRWGVVEVDRELVGGLLRDWRPVDDLSDHWLSRQSLFLAVTKLSNLSLVVVSSPVSNESQSAAPITNSLTDALEHEAPKRLGQIVYANP